MARNTGGPVRSVPEPGRSPSPCRYCGTSYTACVDGDPCCQACLHADGHEYGAPVWVIAALCLLAGCAVVGGLVLMEAWL